MNYNAFFFIGQLYGVTEELRFVNGKEQICLVIPTDTNEIYRGKHGGWYMHLSFREIPVTSKGQTHKIALQFKDKESVERAQRQGWRRRVEELGRIYPHIDKPKVDRTNTCPDIELQGYLSLNDIPQNIISYSRKWKKKYIWNIRIEDFSDPSLVYVGSLCLTEILPRFRYQNPESGKYYTKILVTKLERLDINMNTHGIYAVDQTGAKVEIGRLVAMRNGQPVCPLKYREDENKSNNANGQNPRPPKSIDGIKF